MTPTETLPQELHRLVLEYQGAENRPLVRAEAWNLIADFAVSNVNELVAALSQAEPASLAGREGKPDLVYRPNEFDDWGMIRTRDGKMFATVSRPLSQEEANARRTAKTDPFEGLARALMSAVAPAPAEVQVKALEWSGPDVGGDCRSVGSMRVYVIRAYTGNGHWLTGVGRYFDTREAAKAAAQADYETGIRSALITPPAAGVQEPADVAGDCEETTDRNPRSWAAWKRRAEAAEARLAEVERERDEAQDRAAWAELEFKRVRIELESLTAREPVAVKPEMTEQMETAFFKALDDYDILKRDRVFPRHSLPYFVWVRVVEASNV